MVEEEKIDSFDGDDVSHLRQLIRALEEASMRLEEGYKNNDPEGFNKSKRFVLQIQKKISEALK